MGGARRDSMTLYCRRAGGSSAVSFLWPSAARRPRAARPHVRPVSPRRPPELIAEFQCVSISPRAFRPTPPSAGARCAVAAGIVCRSGPSPPVPASGSSESGRIWPGSSRRGADPASARAGIFLWRGWRGMRRTGCHKEIDGILLACAAGRTRGRSYRWG
jgi:hypothetical protein